MRLASFTAGSGQRAGVLVDGGIVDIARHVENAPRELSGIIARWSELHTGIAAIASRGPDYGMEDVDLLVPIPRPGKILALGMNYKDHCEEAKLPIPAHQSWFSKAVTAANGPFDPILLPSVSDQLDYEAEMVVVIGRRCSNVPAERAGEVVLGYCVGNDVSVRDWQLRTQQHMVGKSFDRAAPFGPWITTADSIDPTALGIKSFVNGELRQNSNTSNFIFSINDMIAYLSQAMTLEPGDILFTGTPAGVGFHWQGGQSFLKEGDIVRVEIEGLGAIENKVEPGPSDVLIA